MTGLMNNKLERTWRKEAMVYFKILSKYLPEETLENHKSS
jgi:hypothetical protein